MKEILFPLLSKLRKITTVDTVYSKLRIIILSIIPCLLVLKLQLTLEVPLSRGLDKKKGEMPLTDIAEAQGH